MVLGLYSRSDVCWCNQNNTNNDKMAFLQTIMF